MSAVLDKLAAPGGDLKSLCSAFRAQPATDPAAAIRELLTHWKTSGGGRRICPLPDLYFGALGGVLPGPGRSAARSTTCCSKMHEAREVYLHSLDRPALRHPAVLTYACTMIGHRQIDYYTSLRDESAAA